MNDSTPPPLDDTPAIDRLDFFHSLGYFHSLDSPLGWVFLLLAILPTFANAHGWIEFPKARQLICYDDGGYWWPHDGRAIPNEACRQAFLRSGTYPLQQKNEFSSVVVRYRDQSAVERGVTDGLLCSGGSSAKAGFDLPSAHWQKTRMEPGQHTLVFNGDVPHDPSFWQIYLSRPGFNASTDSLRWSDLELIASYENVAIDGQRKYNMPFTLPEGRTGAAILFVRWQRDDPGGEGFYNCADIAFSDEGTPEPDPGLIDLGPFVTRGHDIAEPGDKVQFRLLDAQGNEVVSTSLPITQANLNFADWTEQLAHKVNTTNSALVQVGVKSDDDTISPVPQPLMNRVWAAHISYTPSTSVLKDDTPPPGDYDFVYPDGISQYHAGTTVLAKDEAVYTCKPFPASGWCNQAPAYYAPATGSHWVDAWDKQ